MGHPLVPLAAPRAQIAGYFGLNRKICNQSLRADANGHFAFAFQPQIPLPHREFRPRSSELRGFFLCS
jgi:hypothetical protein